MTTLIWMCLSYRMLRKASFQEMQKLEMIWAALLRAEVVRRRDGI